MPPVAGQYIYKHCGFWNSNWAGSPIPGILGETLLSKPDNELIDLIDEGELDNEVEHNQGEDRSVYYGH